jgi:hypothetical protein
VLCVDEGANTAKLLGFGDYVVDKRRLTGRLWAEEFDDSSPWHSTDSEREVERQSTCWDRINFYLRTFIAHPHDGALSELLLNLA